MTDSGHPDLEPFGAQKFTFELQIATISAKSAAGGDDTVTRGGGVTALPHDGPDRAPGARRPGDRGDVAVGGDAPPGDTPNGAKDLRPEIRHV
jgi:hypothetical protein